MTRGWVALVVGAALALAAALFVVPAQSASTAASVPTCAKPTSNVTNQKVVNYVECLQQRTEAMLANLSAPASEPTPTVTPTPTPTPAPTPTPTPTSPSPTPTPTPTPEAPATAADFPTPSSVGPATTPTQNYTGGCYFGTDKNGLVVDGKIVDCDSAGGVRFAQDATGIVFRNSIIRGQMFTVGNTPGDPGAEDATRAPVFTVEDSKVIQASTVDWQDRAACCAHYVIKRSYVQGTHSGLAGHNNVTLIGNYITTDGSHTHQSGVRMLKNSTLRGNTIVCKPSSPGYDGGCSAAGVFYSERLDGTPAAAFNLTIEGNYFKRGVTPAGDPGGPWYGTRFINCANRTDCTGITFTGNKFDLGWGTDGGEFPFYADNVWADNVWGDGAPARSNTSR